MGESREEVLTPRQAADILKVSAEHVRELVRCGAIGAYRFGRVIRIDSRELAAFMERCQTRKA